MRINEYRYLAGVINSEEYHESFAEKNIKCDICNQDAGDQYVDGKTKMGPWANMCMNC